MTHNAHPDGAPLGFPANRETRQWRVKAHEVFDQLWKGGAMGRSDAYKWMIDTLALPPEDAHIGRFSAEQCQRLIAAVRAREQLAALNPAPPPPVDVGRRRAAKRRARYRNRRK